VVVTASVEESMPASSCVRHLAACVALVAPIATGACSYGDDDVGPATGLVTTFSDPAVDFAAETTFAFIDSVVHLAPFGSGRRLPVTRRFDRAVLDRVRASLLARGFAEVAPPFARAPHFIVLVGAAAQSEFDAWRTYSWYTWWGFYPGWSYYAPGFDATWGVVYPWGPTVTVTEFETASLVVELLDASVTPGMEHLTAMWAGVAAAGLERTTSEDRIVEAVDEMFARSPYLTRASHR
jgi:hypothetical protein